MPPEESPLPHWVVPDRHAVTSFLPTCDRGDSPTVVCLAGSPPPPMPSGRVLVLWVPAIAAGIPRPLASLAPHLHALEEVDRPILWYGGEREEGLDLALFGWCAWMVSHRRSDPVRCVLSARQRTGDGRLRDEALLRALFPAAWNPRYALPADLGHVIPSRYRAHSNC